MRTLILILLCIPFAVSAQCGGKIYRVQTLENGATVYESYHFTVYDMLQFIPHYGTDYSRYDFNGDGIINTAEMFNVVGGYGVTAPEIDTCNLYDIPATVVVNTDSQYFDLITADGHTRWWWH